MARTTAEIQDHIEAQLQKIREEQSQLLITRQAASRENYRHTLIMIAVSFLIALALLAAQMFLQLCLHPVSPDRIRGPPEPGNR